VQQLPASGIAVRHAKLAFDYGSHSLDCPQLVREARLQRALEQQRREFGALLRVQPGWSTQSLGFELAYRTIDLAELARPHTDRLSRHTQPSRHFGLRHFALEQARALDTPRLDCLQVPLHRHAVSSTDCLST
jgi:hypothetical protein